MTNYDPINPNPDNPYKVIPGRYKHRVLNLDGTVRCTVNDLPFAMQIAEELFREFQQNGMQKHNRKRAVLAPDGTKYSSIQDASLDLGMTYEAIRYRCENRLQGWKYHDPMAYYRRKVRGPDGTVYLSLREATKAIGHSDHWIKARIGKGWDWV